ncbi:MAG: response regulator [Verrucomicrobiota bacterium]|nr:response regulator [Verrucomicrobiota bacterium]
MKRILIVEDDPVVARIYENRLRNEGFGIEVVHDGEHALLQIKKERPDLLLLDLMLPKMNGVEVLKELRKNPSTEKLPVIVLSNSYVTHMIQAAWKAGATKCLTKSDCTPKQLVEIITSTLEAAASMQIRESVRQAQPAPPVMTGELGLQADLRLAFSQRAPHVLATLRTVLQATVKTETELQKAPHLFELSRIIHSLGGNAALISFYKIAELSSALEALLKELYEKPRNINPSTFRTVVQAVDLLGALLSEPLHRQAQPLPASLVLIVDDEPISRRTMRTALEKTCLTPLTVASPSPALALLQDNPLSIVFSDVDMPEMSGFEFCAEIRKLATHKNTPVIFITGLGDFETRAKSTLSGGTDLIGKPVLPLDVAVKALTYVLKAHLASEEKESE